ncbi:EamA family transporter [bacterium]|nr:EamA family transporter [bacterium]
MSKIPFIVIAVIIGVVGQLLIKYGLNKLGQIDFSESLIVSYGKIFLSPFVISGSLVYFLSGFIWLYALSKVNLSFAYPFLALSYILILLASQWFLGENVSFLRWIGVLVICLGVFLVAKS